MTRLSSLIESLKKILDEEHDYEVYVMDRENGERPLGSVQVREFEHHGPMIVVLGE